MPDLTLEEYKLAREDTYTVSAEKDVNSGDLDLYFQPPSDGRLLLYFAEMSHEASVTVTVYSQVSSVSGGSDAEPKNNAIGSSETHDGTYLEDPSYTGDAVHQTQTFTAESTHNIFNGYKIEIHNDNEVVVNVSNTSGGENTVSVRAAFYEQ